MLIFQWLRGPDRGIREDSKNRMAAGEQAGGVKTGTNEDRGEEQNIHEKNVRVL